MKNFKRIISIFITLKPMAYAFLPLALLTVGPSAQEQHKGSAQRPSARASRPELKDSWRGPVTVGESIIISGVLGHAVERDVLDDFELSH